MSQRESDAQVELLLELIDDADKKLLQRGSVFRYLTRDLAKIATQSDQAADRLLNIPILRQLKTGVRANPIWEIPLEVRRVLMQDAETSDEIRNDVAQSVTDHANTMGSLFARLSASQHSAQARAELQCEFDSALSQDVPDVPKAHDLTLLLTEWPVAHNPKSQELFDHLTPKLNRYARAIRDYEASATYLDRSFESQARNALFNASDSEQWMMQVYAPGGRGKTMYLRNLLGRHCPQNDLPVARIDFDFLEHLAISTQQPWRILLAIAKQLDPQLPGNPFQSMLHARGEYAAQVTSEKLPVQRSVNAPRKWLSGQSYAEDTPSRFREELAGAVKDSPVLIVLDTFENVLHTAGASLAPLLKMLDGVRHGSNAADAYVPGLRVILCGRFDLMSKRSLSGSAATQAAEFRDDWFLPEPQSQASSDHDRASESADVRMGRALVSVRLKDFTWLESETYLRDKCRLTDMEKVSAVMDRCHSPDEEGRQRANPMRLALIGTYLKDNPEIEVSELEEFENLELFYLINRVVDRIADGRVQWLLRWGVLPSILTKEFAKAILWPALIDYLENRTNYDDPTLPSNVANPPDQERWAQLSLESVKKDGSVDAAWAGLLTYAANASWVSVNEELPDAVTFHPEVRDPLRTLLRDKDHPVFHDIHAKAFSYWNGQLSTSHQAQLTAVLRGVTHHLYQPWSEEGKNGGSIRRNSGVMVRDLLSQFASNRLARHEIADGVLRACRQANEGAALAPAPDEQICALLELAEFHIHDTVTGTAKLNEADLHGYLDQIQTCIQQRTQSDLKANLSPDESVSDALKEEKRRRNFLLAVLYFSQNKIDPAWSLFSDSLRKSPPKTPADLAHLQLVVDVSTTLDFRTRPLGVARKLAKVAKGTPVEPQALGFLASCVMVAEKWQEALKVARNAQNTELEATALLELGRAKAVQNEPAFPWLRRAEALTQLMDPESALKLFNHSFKTSEEFLVHAKAELMANEFPWAKSRLTGAMTTEGHRFQKEPATEAWLLLCRILIDEGEYGQATSELNRTLFREGTDDDISLNVRAQLLDILVFHYENHDVSGQLSALLPSNSRRYPPSISVAIVLTQMEIKGTTVRLLGDLANALERMDHFKTRLLALRELWRVKPIKKNSPKLSNLIRRLENLTKGRINEPALKLGRAEMRRVVGKGAQCRPLVDSVIATAYPNAQPQEKAQLAFELRQRFDLHSPTHNTKSFNSGTIRRLSKGFGFIESNSGDELFFPGEALQGLPFNQLFEGQSISYQESSGHPEIHAQQIRIPEMVDTEEAQPEPPEAKPYETMRIEISKRRNGNLIAKPQLELSEAAEFGTPSAELEDVYNSHYRFAKDPEGFQEDLDRVLMRESLAEVWNTRSYHAQTFVVEIVSKDEWSAKMPWELAGDRDSQIIDGASAIVRTVKERFTRGKSRQRSSVTNQPIPCPSIYATSGVNPVKGSSKESQSFGEYELELIGDCYRHSTEGRTQTLLDYSHSGEEQLQQSLDNEENRVFHFVSPIINHKDRAGLRLGDQSFTAESFAAMLSDRSPRLVIFDLYFSHSEIAAAEQLMLANAMFWGITQAEPSISIIGGVFGADRNRKEYLEALVEGLAAGEKLIDLVGSIQKMHPTHNSHPLHSAVSLWTATPQIAFQLGGQQ